MKRFYYAIALPALMLLLWSCNSSGEYVERNGTICYSYWTFSFGTQYHELQGVNPASFKSIENWLGHDNKNVYFKEKLVKGVDIPSIKVKKYPLFGDKNDMYYMGAAMHVANVKGFEVIKWNEDDMWAIDGRCAYYDSIRIDNVDIATFKLQAYNCATDRNHVYRFGKIVPEADPATYIEEWNGLYSRDKNHIWYLGDLIEDIDVATFVIDKDGAHDKNGHFYRGKRVTDEEWQRIRKENDL
ncbi:MAG: DKNYY domain-containing protein [Muribaculaceae bacterium]|nr:DKNYY domain-containing protein [Muribaculaceae bacterium]